MQQLKCLPVLMIEKQICPMNCVTPARLRVTPALHLFTVRCRDEVREEYQSGFWASCGFLGYFTLLQSYNYEVLTFNCVVVENMVS